jgi:hypothetical protein
MSKVHPYVSMKESRQNKNLKLTFKDWILYYHNKLRDDPEYFNRDLERMLDQFDGNYYIYNNDIKIETERGK